MTSQQSCWKSETMSFDPVSELLVQINKVDAVRRAFLQYLQVENQCKCILGSPCHSHKCGCALEMQDYIDKASAPNSPADRKGKI